MSAATRDSLAVCLVCDLATTLPPLAEGERAECPRCGHTLHERQHTDSQRQVAWSVAALVMLALSLFFPFLALQAQGSEHAIIVADAALALLEYDYAALALLVIATIVLMPAVYLGLMLFLHAARLAGRRPPGAAFMARLLTSMQPWMMSDVFIVGVLVAMVKILTLADVAFGVAFVAFCLFTLLLLKTIVDFDPSELWDSLAGRWPAPVHLKPGRAARAQGVQVCKGCEALYAVSRPHCPRCGRRRPAPDHLRLQATWALLATAVILYIPAMVYPVMRIIDFGQPSEQTIVGGVVYLVEVGSWPIALIIFVASVVVPIAKVMALGWLAWKARSSRAGRGRERMRLYKFTEFIGRWSMIDVFVVALLVALVQAGQVMAVYPGPGIVAFGAVVIITMIAAMTFEPQLLWRDSHGQREP